MGTLDVAHVTWALGVAGVVMTFLKGDAVVAVMAVQSSDSSCDSCTVGARCSRVVWWSLMGNVTPSTSMETFNFTIAG